MANNLYWNLEPEHWKPGLCVKKTHLSLFVTSLDRGQLFRNYLSNIPFCEYIYSINQSHLHSQYMHLK